MKAVMWTDSFQAFLMIGGTLAVVARGTFDVGGVQLVWQRAQESGRIEFFK
jgi:sodium-coupled monocarboxylate transporter 8/12